MLRRTRLTTIAGTAALTALLAIPSPASAGKLTFAPGDTTKVRGMYVSPFVDPVTNTSIDPDPNDGLSAALSILRLNDVALGNTRTNRLVLRFHWWGEAFPNAEERLLLRRRRWPVITLMPRTLTLDQIAAGDGDTWLTAQATALEAAIQAGQKVSKREEHAFVRFGHEMNGNWYPWSITTKGATPDQYAAQEASYRAAFRHVHDVFAAAAPDVDMVWAPSWRSQPQVAYNDPMLWYPGDDYVDWIGITGYNRYPNTWTTPAQLFDAIRGQAATSSTALGGDPLANHVGGSKPVMIAETSSIDAATNGTGRSKAAWIADLRTYLLNAPDVHAVIWFDRAKRCADGTTNVATCPLVSWQPADGPTARILPWEWDSSPDTIAPFKAFWGDARIFQAGPAQLVP